MSKDKRACNSAPRGLAASHGAREGVMGWMYRCETCRWSCSFSIIRCDREDCPYPARTGVTGTLKPETARQKLSSWQILIEYLKVLYRPKGTNRA